MMLVNLKGYLAGHYGTTAAIYSCVYVKYGIQFTERLLLEEFLVYCHISFRTALGRQKVVV